MGSVQLRLALGRAACCVVGVSQGEGSEPPADPRVKRVRGFKLLAVRLLALFVRAWNATLRFSYGPGDKEAATYCERPLIMVVWHNRILVTSEIKRRCRRGRESHAMVSASRDGAYLSAFFEAVNIHPVRGSSSKRGLAAAREMLAVLKQERDVAITPDGPRGPIYTFHEGATMLALIARAPLLLLAPSFSSAWRVNAWDGFYIPKPFSRLHLRARPVQPEELPRDRDACSRWIRNAMMELTTDLPAPSRARASEANAKAQHALEDQAQA